MSTTTDATPVRWQRKQAALRDLILRMLCSTGGIVNNQTGDGVASEIRKHYSIPGTKASNAYISQVLGMMVQAGLITRQTTETGACTPAIELVTRPGARDAIRLEFHKPTNLATVLGTPLGSDANETVLKEVHAGYEAIQRAARETQYRESNERVAINVTNALQAAGFAGERARRIRYYLRTLDVAASVRGGEYKHPQLKLWWWTVSTSEIDDTKLMSLIAGDKNFEAWAKEDAKKKAARLGASASATTGNVDDTTVVAAPPKPGPPPGRTAAPTTKTTVAAVVVDEDPTVTLAGIIEELEQRLETQRTEHAAELARKDEVHAAALEEKDDEIAQLQEQLRTRPALDPRVAAVIARHTQNG
jgi:hypothetical protein